LSLIAVVFSACSSDDDSSEAGGLGNPETYTFTDESGANTVSFEGQTTRLQQGEEILGLFEKYGTTEETLNEMFGGVNDLSSGFLNSSLNGTTKIVRAKVAASDDYFGTNKAEQAEIQGVFDTYISNQVTTFLSAFTSLDDVPVAEAGKAGKLGERIVNEKGLEYKQAFNKGLIGAFTLDQIVNNYLSRSLNESNQTANTNNVLDGDSNYTDLEHFWDEAYGYVYGNSSSDSFLYKYINRVSEDADFSNFAEDIETAFITGRAAIVANDYEVVASQVVILRQLLSEVIAIRAVHYLQQGKIKLADPTLANNEDAFHDLSEGYGFVYSLRFTQDPTTNEPFFSKEIVDGFIAQLEEGNGFWDFDSADSIVLDTISETIAAKFDFTIAEATTIDAL